MAGQRSSIKRVLIGKANATIVAVTSAACFVIIFCLVASKTLGSQLSYQNRIISAKKQTLAQLKADIKATADLQVSYQGFIGTSRNVLGGLTKPATAADGSLLPSTTQDGDNAKIVLDALPSKYDFPALATSLEKILTSQNVQIQSITGTDDELAQATNQTSTNPAPIAMPFQVTLTGDYQAIQNVVATFQQSIRPFPIKTLTISANNSNLTLVVTAQTFYQPEKSLTIRTKVIK